MATNWSQLTVVDLRQELKRRGLPQTGKKAELVDRLTAAESEANDLEEGTTSQTDDAPTTEPPTELPVQSPLNTVSEPQTDPQPDAAGISQLADVPAKDAPLESDLPHLDPPDRRPDPTPFSTDQPPADQEVANSGEFEKTIPVELAPSIPELSQDTANRKRRSRSPPPDDDISRKRARPTEDDDGRALKATYSLVTADASHTTVQSEPVPEPESRAPPSDRPTVLPEAMALAEESYRDSPPSEDRRRDREPSYDAMEEDERDVAPSEHPATPALYIKNFMRPLRENFVRDYLSELAVPRGNSPDPAIIVDFHLDQLRTHAFVQFRNTAAASRVRTALHQRVWPNESNRKQLWVDFIPAEVVADWSSRELNEGGRFTRWEVRYDIDDYGNTTAHLVNADGEPSRQPERPYASSSSAQPPIPTGPSRPFAGGVEGAPLGPRGRGRDAYRQQSFPTAVGDYRETQTYPPLLWKPVSEDLVERRLINMRSYYTKDRDRDMGREDEINRYTFENGDGFVDRGKEVFIGIRPPHRERERRQAMAGGRGPPPSYPPMRGDRYFGAGRGGSDAPRSRLDGAPLPTYDNYRYGGRD
ncbi:hypothetical protein OQA88_2819 [Cercophora sp. LCS_1]